jgi:ATP-dependent DNA helicase RecQ
VPSRKHPELVPDLAERIGRQLRLPVISCIEKTRHTAPQKIQEGSYNQCHNLDGAFEIRGTPPSGPVLLIDDLVDSGWTFSILALMLRRAGSGPVHPFALASTRKRDT